MTIYDMVKQAADAEGMSIAELEREAEVANGTVSKWKTGKPRVETLVKIADVLKTDITTLIPL